MAYMGLVGWLLPIYISYFAGGEEGGTKKALTGALGFVHIL